jgi:tetratricopeptide (TPR) repeat protein
MAAGLVFNVLIYYGALVEKNLLGVDIPPDHSTMQATLITASRLDPYNMDIYYFAQSMVWNSNKIREITELLEYGMRYRDWDFYLPFFAGFNSAFFLKDYAAAAQHFATAARLSGSDLFTRLSSRFMYEAGQTGLAIDYLTAMIKSSKNEAIKKTFQTRHAALLEVRRIEQARDAFRQKTGRLPKSIGELQDAGILTSPPGDPYGGEFYLDPDGTVRTTSKLANPSQDNQ